jgi:hypothetical protein
MTVGLEPVLLIQLFIICCAVLIDFVRPQLYNNKKETSMNLLFERVRIQAQISRLYDLVSQEQADEIVRSAWQLERSSRVKTFEQQLKAAENNQPALAR